MKKRGQPLQTNRLSLKKHPDEQSAQPTPLSVFSLTARQLEALLWVKKITLALVQAS